MSNSFVYGSFSVKCADCGADHNLSKQANFQMDWEEVNSRQKAYLWKYVFLCSECNNEILVKYSLVDSMGYSDEEYLEIKEATEVERFKCRFEPDDGWWEIEMREFERQSGRK